MERGPVFLPTPTEPGTQHKQHAQSNTRTAQMQLSRNCLIPNPTSMHAPGAPRTSKLPEANGATAGTRTGNPLLLGTYHTSRR